MHECAKTRHCWAAALRQPHMPCKTKSTVHDHAARPFFCEKPPLKINNLKINCKFKVRILLATSEMQKTNETLDGRGFLCYVCGRKINIKPKQKI